MSRGTVVNYARRALGLDHANFMGNIQLVIAVGLWRAAKPINQKQAVEILKSTTEYDLIVKAPRPEHHQRRAAPVARTSREKDKFYSSRRWLELRYLVLKKSGGFCQCCGAKGGDGVRLDVDHVKPKSTHPELALDESNLQVLCQDCNSGKSNKDETDWRIAGEYAEAEIARTLRRLV